MRVLLVEDERTLAGTVERGLRREGMAVDDVLDGAKALEKAGVNKYDVVVLDRAYYDSQQPPTASPWSSYWYNNFSMRTTERVGWMFSCSATERVPARGNLRI